MGKDTDGMDWAGLLRGIVARVGSCCSSVSSFILLFPSSVSARKFLTSRHLRHIVYITYCEVGRMYSLLLYRSVFIERGI